MNTKGVGMLKLKGKTATDLVNQIKQQSDLCRKRKI